MPLVGEGAGASSSPEFPPGLCAIGAVVPCGATGIGGRVGVSEGQWARFVSREITSRFPDGLTVFDARGRVIFHAPVSVGSKHDPLPLGHWKVTTVSHNPIFHYNPDLFWDARPEHAKAQIQPGPNNPVGVVWIGTSREHYGLHGTPAPSRVGHSQTHGCVTMTNWDALRLAGLVQPGTAVVFE